jgi:hypothetical protein
MVGGVRPYSLEISAKGDVAVFTNQGGRPGDIDVINVVDLKAKPAHCRHYQCRADAGRRRDVERWRLRRRHGDERFEPCESGLQ